MGEIKKVKAGSTLNKIGNLELDPRDWKALVHMSVH